MFLLMRRLLATSVLALLALCAISSAAFAATPKPTITSVSPSQVAVGGTLILKGKNFRSGVRNNRVYFARATDGKSVRVRPKKASKTRLEVVVPTALTALLDDDGLNGKKATRFQIMIFTTVAGPKTKRSRSPIISPQGATTPVGTPPPPPDCDADGTPDAQDADDDNDGLGDDVESSIHTDACKADTDGDGVQDAFEYYSSLDLNGTPNYAGKRPYPNPLDPGDAAKDFDGDGLTMTEEFNAAKKFGSATSAPMTYSEGTQQSAGPGNTGAMDLDNNGRITDEEKDADNDGLANWLEIAKGDAENTAWGCDFEDSTGPGPVAYANIYTVCNGGPMMPNGNTFSGTKSTYVTGASPSPINAVRLDYLDADTDGDGISDSQDDLDFDGLSDIEEITAGTDGYYTAPFDPCDPNPDSRTCPTHPPHV
jgi:IPT/TIG domain